MAIRTKAEPRPCQCCGEDPAIVRTRTGPAPWRVTCPWLDCDEHASAYGSTEREAIDKWNRGEVV